MTDILLKFSSLLMAMGLFCLSCRTSFSYPLGTDTKVNKPLACPRNFVMVSGSHFCVAKYEMKREGLDNAVAAAEGSPWVNLTREKAIHLCKKMGAGFDLISNNQWQALAQEIEQTPENWRDGPAVGSGAIQRDIQTIIQARPYHQLSWIREKEPTPFPPVTLFGMLPAMFGNGCKITIFKDTKMITS